MTLSHDFVSHHNNILLRLSIALIYHFVPNGLPFQYTKPHSSIIRNRLSTSHCWEIHQPLSHLLRGLLVAISFVGKRSLRYHYHHPTIFPFIGKQPSLIWFHWGFRFLLIALQLRANDLVIIQINLRQVSSFTQSIRLLELPYRWWEYGLLDAISTAPWCLIGPVAEI